MKRYNIYSGERPSIVEAFDGWWVKWEDAEREVAQLMERVEQLERTVYAAHWDFEKPEEKPEEKPSVCVLCGGTKLIKWDWLGAAGPCPDCTNFDEEK